MNGGRSGKGLTATSVPVWRRRGAVLLVSLYVLMMWVGFLGLVDLPAGFVGPGRAHVVDGSYGALTLIIIPAGFLAQVRLGRERVAGVHQVWAATLALTVAGLLATEYRYLALAAVVFLGSILLVGLDINRRRFIHARRNFAPAFAVLTALAAGPSIGYALSTASNARALAPPRDAETNGFHHWTAATALAICVVILVGLGTTRAPGWRVAAFSAAAAGAVWGMSSLLYPSDAGSGGKMWGALAVIWCTAVVVAAFSVPRSPDPEGIQP